MRLHHHPMSSNARRAVMTAKHLGVDVELVPVDLSKGEQKRPAFLKLNPNGRVPVLEDGELVLTESHAIMTYLADLTPGQTVYPTERRARADVDRWLFWSAAHFQPAASVLNWEHFVKPFLGLTTDPREVARGEQLVTQVGAVLDGHLAGKEWVAQDRLTLADLALATPLMMHEKSKLPIAPFASLRAWFERVRKLDAWRETDL